LHKENKNSQSRPKTIAIAGFLVLFIFSSFFIPEKENENIQIDNYFKQSLYFLKLKTIALNKSVKEKKNLATLQSQFRQARLAYKKVAVLIDFFNPYEIKYLNGPAVNRVEDDNPDDIIPPHGFQAIEEYLFGKWQPALYDKLDKEVAYMLGILLRIEKEPDRINKFRNENVFEAIQSGIIRLIILGISGFDSPIAQQSIPEAKTTIDGIQQILVFYKKEILKKDAKKYKQLIDLIYITKKYLSDHPDFNSFDRIAFITRFANPLYSLIGTIRGELGYVLTEGLWPVNSNASTIFDTDAFNISFFSPDKRYKVTPERMELGKQLFYDPILSQAKNRTCATCHKPELAFTDGFTSALSVDEKTHLARNTPTLLNSVFQTKQFYDSRTSILESQLSDVLHNQEEMKGSLKKSVTDLKKNLHYASLFGLAYPEAKEPVSEYNIANAISSYVRSLVAMNSKFDKFMRCDKTQLSKNEKYGFNLFMGKAKCGTCHFMPLFNGLVPPEFSETESEVLGVPNSKDTVKPSLDPDPGRFNFTHSRIHKHAFKIPTLRNIVLTAPYMHNGVFSTLEEVMDFYNKGGGSGLHIAPENQTLPQARLNLSKKEIRDIVSFLKCLTDTTVNAK
jgi:cytochrome c peroxidase